MTTASLWQPAAWRRSPGAHPQPPPPARALTRRQQDVLSLLAQGRSTKDIARTLDLGIGTIKAHLDGLYRTLGVHNRVAAVARVQAFSRQNLPDIAPPDITLSEDDPDQADTTAATSGGHNVIRLESRIGPCAPAAADQAAQSATAVRYARPRRRDARL